RRWWWLGGGDCLWLRRRSRRVRRRGGPGSLSVTHCRNGRVASKQASRKSRC
ncbi:unnamed protein product, partial [Discosporangium mesarthrocarpum]